MKNIGWIRGAVGALIVVALLGAGGFPARPRFQAVGVNLPAPESGVIDAATDVRINGVSVVATAAGPSPAIQYSNGGAFAGDGDFTYNASTNYVSLGSAALGGGLRGFDATSAGSGGSLEIGAGNANGTGNGGALTLTLGSPNTSGNGGTFTVLGRSGSGNGDGSDLVFTAGNGSGSGAAGDINFTTGTGGGFGAGGIYVNGIRQPMTCTALFNPSGPSITSTRGCGASASISSGGSGVYTFTHNLGTSGIAALCNAAGNIGNGTNTPMFCTAASYNSNTLQITTYSAAGAGTNPSQNFTAVIFY